MKKLLLTLLLCSVSFGQWSGVKPPLGTQLDFSNPLANGLLGLWLMNEGSGTTIADLSGNGNTGTLVSNTVWVPGKYGSALNFPSHDDGVNCGGVPGSESGREITVLVEFRTETAITWGSAIIKRTSWILSRAGGNDEFKWGVFKEADASKVEVTIPYAFDNSWTQMVGVSDYTNIYGYKDGKFIGSSVFGDSIDTSGNDVVISHPAEYPLFGDISHAMIWDRALTAGEVASLYADPFQMFQQQRLPIASAAAPAGGGQFISIMMSKVSPYLITMGIISILAGTLGYSTRKAA